MCRSINLSPPRLSSREAAHSKSPFSPHAHASVGIRSLHQTPRIPLHASLHRTAWPEPSPGQAEADMCAAAEHAYVDEAVGPNYVMRRRRQAITPAAAEGLQAPGLEPSPRSASMIGIGSLLRSRQRPRLRLASAELVPQNTPRPRVHPTTPRRGPHQQQQNLQASLGSAISAQRELLCRYSPKVLSEGASA